jgi:hypothetical protein
MSQGNQKLSILVKTDKGMQIDHGDGAWRDSTYFRFDIEDLHDFKKLKSAKIESAYIDTILSWSEKDNKMPTEHISTMIHFMTKLVNFNDKFIKKHNVKPYHINLIRRLFIDFDDYDDNDKKAHMGYKRPYGNSNVLSDVYEEYEKVCGFPIKFEDLPIEYLEDYVEGEEDPTDIISEYISDRWMNENVSFLLNIHNEVMDILEYMIKELEFTSFEWVPVVGNKIFGNDTWKPTEKGIQQYNNMKRENKLERILKK